MVLCWVSNNNVLHIQLKNSLLRITYFWSIFCKQRKKNSTFKLIAYAMFMLFISFINSQLYLSRWKHMDKCYRYNILCWLLLSKLCYGLVKKPDLRFKTMARNFNIVDRKHSIYQYHFFLCSVQHRKMYIVFIVINIFILTKIYNCKIIIL